MAHRNVIGLRSYVIIYDDFSHALLLLFAMFRVRMEHCSNFKVRRGDDQPRVQWNDPWFARMIVSRHNEKVFHVLTSCWCLLQVLGARCFSAPDISRRQMTSPSVSPCLSMMLTMCVKASTSSTVLPCSVISSLLFLLMRRGFMDGEAYLRSRACHPVCLVLYMLIVDRRQGSVIWEVQIVNFLP